MANSDVSPELFRKLENSFDANLSADKTAASLQKKIISGKGTYKDAGKYAERIGMALQKAMDTHLGGDALPNGIMYWHIAEDVLEPLLKEEYSLVSAVAMQTQSGMNARAGIGLKPIKTKYDKALVGNIMGMANNAEQYSDIATEMGETVVTFARSVVDQTMKANVEFQGNSGRSPLIVRRAGENCCPWCADLDGVYEYPNVPDDVYKHHDYCKCSLDYEDRYGTSNVWENQKWSTDEALEERKTHGL